MINSALVSGQQRKRCYWTNISNVKQPNDKGILLKDILESGIIDREKSRCIIGNCGRTTTREYFKKSQGQMVAEPVCVNDSNKPVRLGHIGKSNGQANRIYSIKGKSVCLQSQSGGGGAKTGLYKIDLPDGDYLIRKLTPIEAERLQTLPDNYTEGISNTQRYKCIGNGWTVDVIAHILKNLKGSD